MRVLKIKVITILIGIVAAGLGTIASAAPKKGLAPPPRFPFDWPMKYANESLGTLKGSYKEKPLEIEVFADSEFSKDQKALLKEAMEVFVERSLRAEVLDCAYKTSTKDLPSSRERLEEQLFSALAPIEVFSKPRAAFAIIAMFDKIKNVPAVAHPGYFYDEGNPIPGYKTRHVLYIALNSDYLGPASDYTYAKDKEYFAGVLAHEFLHNLSYKHPTGYAGSFIAEYGLCLWGNGKKPEGKYLVEEDSLQGK